MRESEDSEIISMMSKCDTYNREYCRKSDHNEDVISTLLDFNKFFGHSVQLYCQLNNKFIKNNPKISENYREKECSNFICDACP